MTQPTTNDFKRMVLEDIPLIDVRAPVEFAAGAFPNAVNLPLMNDEERHRVGLCYKEKGQDAAIELGHKLVCGPVKEARIAAWKSFMEEHPNALIYCFRGGLRSQLSQQWTNEALGRDIQRLEGGYKAFRHFLMDHLEPNDLNSTPIVIGGRTGCGKTLLLQKLENKVDLEKLANHRGSSFGRFINPQPTQIDFENRLARALIQHEASGHRLMVVEDEGRHVGRCYLPPAMVEHFAEADVILLETPLEERVQITFDEYVNAAQQAFIAAFGDEGLSLWMEDIRSSMTRVRKRLGGERLKRVLQLLDEANAHQRTTGESAGHKSWVEVLLVEYYDPMYDYQLENKRKKIVFTGNADAVIEHLAQL